MRRILPLGPITLGVLLSVAALGQLYLDGRVNSAATIDLPNEVDPALSDEALQPTLEVYP